MKCFINETARDGAAESAKRVILDDMILSTALPTTCGSLMLENFTSLFDAEVVERLTAAGYGIAGKANVGEFNIDLLGESSYFGACTNTDGALTSATSLLLAEDANALAAVGLDVNGAQRRAAALSGQVCLKPSYGCISRFGTVAIACSGEAVSVSARNARDCQEIVDVLAGHDSKDGTSLPEAQCADITTAAAPEREIKRVALVKSLADAADAETQARINAAADALRNAGVEVTEVDGGVLDAAYIAWNILMSAELCNNVSRFDGVKYGYRTKDFTTIGELYTNSRTEAFGTLLKTAILFGSEVLSEQNYYPFYDKSMRIRRLCCEYAAALFEQYDALLLPACSKTAYTPEELQAQPTLVFTENKFTAPASITGFPAVVAGGVQLMGPALSDAALLRLAEVL